MEHSSGVSLTKAYLNKPLCPCSKQTVALLIKADPKSSPVHTLKVSEPLLVKGYRYNEDSAVMFTRGKAQPLKAHAEKSTIIINGINTPPKESSLVFYTLEKNKGHGIYHRDP